ncbi:MAG TPA: hypothetical protein DCS78_12635 [Pseudoalteromonas shioyasakiensis]|nr:hypothetical protein [Pseudoalteromonas shioyasakiensis]|tara:strand:- start:1584 stop:1850 length:267 start_codon:yes stop_codon:yes gene_type:complete
MVAKNKLINATEQIDNAEVVQAGYERKSVRMKYEGKEIGFATTTYSHHQTDEIKEYAAERITLLMMLAKGMTNKQIMLQVARNLNRNK